MKMSNLPITDSIACKIKEKMYKSSIIKITGIIHFITGIILTLNSVHNQDVRWIFDTEKVTSL